MSYQKIISWLVLLIVLIQLVPFVSGADEPSLVISEVMANPNLSETTDEFIEVFNYSENEIDISGWEFTDGDSVDEIIAWQNDTHGIIDNTTTNTTLVPPKTYAVILDSNYATGEQPYDFPNETIILTTKNSTLGNGLTASSDPITLYSNEGTGKENIADTYGTPLDKDDPLERDDDNLDEIPFDPGNGVSVEKINLSLGDQESNWAANSQNSATPGKTNNPFLNYAPEINQSLANPSEISLGTDTSVLFEVLVNDQNGYDDIKEVTIDLQPCLGDKEQTLYDNGTNGDKDSQDNWFSYEYSLPNNLNPGLYELSVQALDQSENVATETINLQINIANYSDQVFINELLPNPSSPESEGEFIELFNNSNENVNLTNWEIGDASKTYTITEGTTIAAQEYLVFYNQETGISLNNSGDEAQLQTPLGEIRDQVVYNDSADEDVSYARRDDNNFAWTKTPTPGQVNEFSIEEDEEDTNRSETENNEAESKPGLDLQKISDVRNEDKNTKVKTAGIVTVSPGVLSDKYFYIQDEKAGIQIYLSSGDFPKLKPGDYIEVIGKTSESQNEKRINIKDGEAKVIETKEIPTPLQKATGEIEEELEGMLITTTAAISKQSGQTFYLDDDSGELKVSILKNTNIEKPKMKKGESVTITGIVDETKSGYRILPRIQDDLKYGQVAGATDEKSQTELPEAGANTKLVLLISTVLTLASFTIWKIWKPIKKSPTN